VWGFYNAAVIKNRAHCVSLPALGRVIATHRTQPGSQPWVRNFHVKTCVRGFLAFREAQSRIQRATPCPSRTPRELPINGVHAACNFGNFYPSPRCNFGLSLFVIGAPSEIAGRLKFINPEVGSLPCWVGVRGWSLNRPLSNGPVVGSVWAAAT
jgi:hypothetical protein